MVNREKRDRWNKVERHKRLIAGRENVERKGTVVKSEVAPVAYPFGRPLTAPPPPKGASKWRLKSQCGVGGRFGGRGEAGKAGMRWARRSEREGKRWGVVSGAALEERTACVRRKEAKRNVC